MRIEVPKCRQSKVRERTFWFVTEEDGLRSGASPSVTDRGEDLASVKNMMTPQTGVSAVFLPALELCSNTPTHQIRNTLVRLFSPRQ